MNNKPKKFQINWKESPQKIFDYIKSYIWNKTPRKLKILELIIIALMGLIISISIISPAFLYNCNLVDKFREHVFHKHKQFQKGIFGILVAQFGGIKTNIKGLEYQSEQLTKEIITTTRNRFDRLKLSSAEIEELPEVISSHAEARVKGMEYNASLVIWGEITTSGTFYKITFVHLRPCFITHPEAVIDKDSNSPMIIEGAANINLSAFTDEPVYIATFFAGLKL